MRSVPNDHTDLAKAVMEDGEWYLVPTEHVDSKLDTNCVSVIVHKCPEWTDELLSPGNKPYEPLGYWVTPESVNTACSLCDVPPPETIASLFMLHNFDTFAGAPDVYGRTVIRQISEAWSRGLHRFAVTNVEGPCPCRECHDKFGAWQ